MYTTRNTLRVRYAETDQMGFAYYGSYMAWLEVGRVEALRELGIVYRDLELEGVLLPVSEVCIRYLRPVRYDDEITIETTIVEEPAARIKFAYSIIVDNTVVSEAETTLFFMQYATLRPMRCPQSITDALAPYFNDEAE
jgi:acyl-CoA thioester hydrolase